MAETLELNRALLGADLHGEFLRAPVRSMVRALSDAVFANHPICLDYAYVEDGPDRVDITVNAEPE